MALCRPATLAHCPGQSRTRLDLQELRSKLQRVLVPRSWHADLPGAGTHTQCPPHTHAHTTTQARARTGVSRAVVSVSSKSSSPRCRTAASTPKSSFCSSSESPTVTNAASTQSPRQWNGNFPQPDLPWHLSLFARPDMAPCPPKLGLHLLERLLVGLVRWQILPLGLLQIAEIGASAASKAIPPAALCKPQTDIGAAAASKVTPTAAHCTSETRKQELKRGNSSPRMLDAQHKKQGHFETCRRITSMRTRPSPPSGRGSRTRGNSARPEEPRRMRSK